MLFTAGLVKAVRSTLNYIYHRGHCFVIEIVYGMTYREKPHPYLAILFAIFVLRNGNNQLLHTLGVFETRFC